MNSPKCQNHSCQELSIAACDMCDRYFCIDHGSAGYDRQMQDVGAVAYPALCWKCGGFNVDA